MKSKDVKLTLKLSQSLIRKGKNLAKKRGQSLSRMVEGYLQAVSEPAVTYGGLEITPLVKELSGIVKLPAGYSEKRDYQEYLRKKYGR